MTATLIGRRWGGRTLAVRCDDEEFTVKYTPWGWNAESVSVDDIVVVKRSGQKMSHDYRFRLGERLASLSVAVPWWAETFPLSDLIFVRLEVSGEVLYEEGRVPNHPLQCTVAEGGFPVIPEWPGRALAMLFGFGLVLWPFLSFGAIFIFDSPIQSRSDLLARYSLAYFIWFYPVTYGATCLVNYLLRKCGVRRLFSCFAWGLPVVVYFILPTVVAWRGVEDSNPKRVQLLYRTDHVALLAACREVMANRNTFEQRREDFRAHIDPKDPNLPAIILALQPTSIITDDENSVYLQLHGGSDDFGVYAYSEHEASRHTNSTEQILLTSGLLFFDRGLTYKDRDKYLSKLKALKPDDAPNPKF